MVKAAKSYQQKYEKIMGESSEDELGFMEILIHFVIPLEAMFSSTSISFVILQA